jgi:hypothetical protein
MAREHSTSEVPEDRAVSAEERSLVRWLHRTVSVAVIEIQMRSSYSG